MVNRLEKKHRKEKKREDHNRDRIAKRKVEQRLAISRANLLEVWDDRRKDAAKSMQCFIFSPEKQELLIWANKPTYHPNFDHTTAHIYEYCRGAARDLLDRIHWKAPHLTAYKDPNLGVTEGSVRIGTTSSLAELARRARSETIQDTSPESLAKMRLSTQIASLYVEMSAPMFRDHLARIWDEVFQWLQTDGQSSLLGKISGMDITQEISKSHIKKGSLQPFDQTDIEEFSRIPSLEEAMLTLGQRMIEVMVYFSVMNEKKNGGG